MGQELGLLNDLTVIKRDGRETKYNTNKVYRAILRASKGLRDNPEEIADKITTKIEAGLKRHVGACDSMSVSELQDIVEFELMKSMYKDVATAYIEYRSARDRDRKDTTDVNVTINRLLAKDKKIVNENANKDSKTFTTHRDLTAGVVSKTTGLKLLPKAVANAHIKGDIHYHDLDYQPYSPMTNCCLIDFKGMLENGFTIGNAEVESPKSINTAMAQVSQIIANVASSQYGGCSFNRADEVLAKYAEMNYNKHYGQLLSFAFPNENQKIADVSHVVEEAQRLTRKDIYDAMQAHEYEINTLFSSNGQTPFYTLNFGLGTGIWEREIQKAILQVRIKGLGKEGRTAIFPKLVMGIKKGVNFYPTDPNYDIKQLALECATKRMYPDILNYDKLVELTGSYKSPMGCRSFLQGWQDENGNEVADGRMNLGVVTLNLPRIALESNGDKEAFWELFEERLAIVQEALVFRMKHVIENASPDMAPILYKYGAFGKRLSSEDSVREVFENLRATISMGYIGLYEVATVFYGGEWEGNTEAKDFTLEIMSKMKTRALELSNKYGVWFSVYSTPAESLTDRFCSMDKEKYGEVKDVTDKDYYTNSFHYDVRKSPTPFEKIDFEKDYPQFCSGGFIHYCEYPVMTWNTKALEQVWDYSYDKIGYLGTNTPIDKCHLCGFEGEFEPTEIGYKCPTCENSDPKTVDVVKRQCGYLGQPQARPNAYGRKKEIDARVKHV